MSHHHKDRRRRPRVRVAGRLRVRLLSGLPVHLLDLSRTGARLRHQHPLAPGATWRLELPPGLGEGALAARVVYTRLVRQQAGGEGFEPHYESDVEFLDLTPDQKAMLASAVKRFAPKAGFQEGWLVP